MKKRKIWGCAAIAFAFIAAVGTSPNAKANRYWRFDPSGTEISVSKCTVTSTNLCANIYSNDGTQFLGAVNKVYAP